MKYSPLIVIMYKVKCFLPLKRDFVRDESYVWQCSTVKPLLSPMAAEMCMHENPDARRLRVCDSWVTHSCNQSCIRWLLPKGYETEPVTLIHTKNQNFEGDELAVVDCISLRDKNFLHNGSLRVPVWIGLRKNKYQWTDVTELQYEDWNSNQPRSYTRPTAYVYLHKGGRWKWFDVQYGSQRYVPLCKMPKPSSGMYIF